MSDVSGLDRAHHLRRELYDLVNGETSVELGEGASFRLRWQKQPPL